MANKVFTILGKIDIDNSNAKKQITETTQEGERSTGSLVSTLGKAAAATVAIGTTVAAGAAAAYKALSSMASSAAENADLIDKGSQRMKVSTTFYQQLGYAANQCGVEMTSLEKAAKKLEGTDLNMEDAMQQIMSLGTAEERASKATELFGKSVAYQLTPLINQSSESYNGLIEKANELGFVMSEEAIKSGVEYGDAVKDISLTIDGLKNNLATTFLPILMQIFQVINDKMPEIQAMFDKLAPVLGQLLETIVPLLLDLASAILPPIFDLIMALMPLFNAIIENILPVFNEILQLVMPLLVDLVEMVLPLLTPFLDLISALLMPILKLLEPILALLQPFIDLIIVIANIISGALKIAINAIADALTGMFKVWKSVFDAILNVAKKPINAVIDVINNLIKGFNKIKLPDWVPGLGGKGINIPLIKKLRVGLEYVPYDEMPALLHKGEAILNKDEAQEYRENKYRSNEINTNNYNNVINIEHLEVRDEMDIQRISEELYYLQKKAEV